MQTCLFASVLDFTLHLVSSVKIQTVHNTTNSELISQS
jgi:hypothetical protein